MSAFIRVRVKTQRQAPLWDAWRSAATEATVKLRIWCTAPNEDKAEAHVAYLAALDREEHAALVLGQQLRPRTQ
jgi:hypothetical protein